MNKKIRYVFEFVRGISCILFFLLAFWLLREAYFNYLKSDYDMCAWALFLVGFMIYRGRYFFLYCFLYDDVEEFLRKMEGDDDSEEDD